MTLLPTKQPLVILIGLSLSGGIADILTDSYSNLFQLGDGRRIVK